MPALLESPPTLTKSLADLGLGNILASRIRLHPAPGTATIDDVDRITQSKR